VCFAGFVVGFVMTLSNYGFLAALLMLFVAGSKVTAWRSSYKKKFEADFKEGFSFVVAFFTVFSFFVVTPRRLVCVFLMHHILCMLVLKTVLSVLCCFKRLIMVIRADTEENFISDFSSVCQLKSFI